MDDTRDPRMGPDALAALGELDAMLARCMNEINARQQMLPVPDVVYHYTGDDGLHGILSTATMRLTDAWALNDPTEVRHGIAPALRVMRQGAVDGPPDVQKMAGVFHTLPAQLGRIGRFSVACTSREGDDLGQWRAYAQDGRGYAIGLDARALVRALKNLIGDAAGSFPILYEDALLEKLQSQLVDEAIKLVMLPAIASLDARAKELFLLQIGPELAAHVIQVALNFKHAAYKNEAEFRLLAVHTATAPLPGGKWLRRSHELVNYLDCPWDLKIPGVVREIVIGPASDESKAARFVQNCLAESGYAGVQVRRSSIPYRPR